MCGCILSRALSFITCMNAKVVAFPVAACWYCRWAWLPTILQPRTCPVQFCFLLCTFLLVSSSTVFSTSEFSALRASISIALWFCYGMLQTHALVSLRLSCNLRLAASRQKEARAINVSLTALGKVVLHLSHNGDAGHVPYRDSKLTRVLKNSLSGNSYTTLLSTLHPAADNYDECFLTLQVGGD